MEIILAIITGGAFGFVLQKAGAANPQKIINMLRLKDLHLMKAILFAIGLSSLLLFSMMALGLVSNTHLSVKSAYVGVLVGGGILGFGWSISGFCPGTGLVGAGAGRKDAIFFVLGGLLGTLLFTLLYGSLTTTLLFDELWGGKSTLANTGVDKYVAQIDSIPAVVVAGVIAVVFMFIAWKLPVYKSEKT